MVRQNVQERIGRKTITRQHKTAPKHRRGRILKRTVCREPSQHQKSTTVDTVHISPFSAAIPTDGRCHFGVRRSRSGGREQATNRRTGTRTVDGCETPCPPSKFSLGPQTSLETSPAPRCETLQGRTACWTAPSGFGDVERTQSRSQQTLFGIRAWSSATRWPQFGLPTAVP